MLDVVIRKRGHSIVRVVIVRLVADVKALDACVTGSGLEVLREELALLIEVVTGALEAQIRYAFIDMESRYGGNLPRRLVCPEDHRSTS